MKKGVLFIVILFLFSPLIAHKITPPVIHKPFDEPAITQPRYIPLQPPSGLEIVNPAEFGRSDGVILAWPGWGNEIIGDIAFEVAQDYKVFMVVANDYYETVAAAYLSSVGVNMANVSFIHDSTMNNSGMWIRDYGPFCIHDDGKLGIDDFVWSGNYGIDLIPYTIADTFNLPLYHSNVIHHGGNHISDGNGMGFFSTNIFNHNTSYTHTQIKQEFKNFFGIDSMVVFAPMNGDGTGHVDMFCKLLNDTLLIVGEYETPGASYPGDYDLLNNLAAYLGTLTNIDGRKFHIERIPMPAYYYGGPAGTINYTYTNSLIINNKVLVPVYGFDMDAAALQVYADLMPDHEIIGIDSEFIIQYWGAVHCITSELFSNNPLIVLHHAIDTLIAGVAPQIKFRLNPKFAVSEGSVFYKLGSEIFFTEVTAELNNGIWSASLPAMSENFSYYIEGSSVSGSYNFETTLPENAPWETFPVLVENVAVDNESISATFCLSNHPNPFNPLTTISFNISYPGKVELSIYNSKGQKVKNLLNEPKESGTYSIVWNGRDEKGQGVESGIYFIRLATEKGHTTIKRMVLLR